MVDTAIYDQLSSTGKFVYMNPSQDEAEHSLELHMPFLMETMRGKDFTLVPIVVGALSPELEAEYGELLAPYLEDPSNFFIVSSDFCHWGSRFNYVYYHRAKGEIHESIEWLDREGMNLIESGDPRAFSGYLSKYGNTICGRHPIGVFLNALSQSKLPHDIKFTAYDQSHKCQTLYDSSVSYASAIISLAGTAQENGRS